MSRLLDVRYKTPLHVVQLILVLITLILGAVRLLTASPSAPRNRSGGMAIGISAKALIVIAYQLLTEHVARLHRYASLKANLILNCLEVVFWGAVAFLTIQANVQYCEGTACTIGWVVVVLSIVLNILASYVAALSFMEYRRGKGHEKSARQVENISV